MLKFINKNLKSEFSLKKSIFEKIEAKVKKNYFGKQNNQKEKLKKQFLRMDKEDEDINQFISKSDQYKGVKQQKFDAKNKKVMEEFRKGKLNLEERLENYMRDSKNLSDLQSRSNKIITQDKGKVFSEINQDINYLDNFDRFDFYKNNYLESVQNNNLQVNEEDKRDSRDFFRKQIKQFFKGMDKEIDQTGKKVPLSLKAQLANDIKRIEENKYDLHEDDYYNQFQQENAFRESTPRIKKFQTELDFRKQEFEQEFVDLLNQQKKKFIENKEMQIDDLEEDFETKYLDEFIQTQEIQKEDEGFVKEEKKTLSFRSQQKIYQLFLKGWEVRDLSFKFGCTPLRIKNYIWKMQYFYEEKLPRIDLEQACVQWAAEEDKTYNDKNVIDYGVDYDKLVKMNKGMIRLDFPKNSYQHYLQKNNESKMKHEEIQQLVNKTKKPKDQFVIENYTSSNKLPFEIVNWIPSKGKNSLKVSTTFRNVVQRSHYKGFLIEPVRKRAEKGPRYAAFGRGHK